VIINPVLKKRPMLWFLSILFAGFLAGIGTYESILRIAQLEVVSKTKLAELKSAAGDSRGAIRRVAVWIGSWETDTDTYENLRVRFMQTTSDVTGTYRVPSQTSLVEEGQIEGRISGNALVGQWIERRNGRDLRGEILFVLLDDGRSFVGTYTREREGNRERHVWTGRKIE